MASTLMYLCSPSGSYWGRERFLAVSSIDDRQSNFHRVQSVLLSSPRALVSSYRNPPADLEPGSRMQQQRDPS